jgi:hypothetical protein
VSLKEKFESLMDSPDLKELTGAGSNTRRKFEGRIKLGTKWFGE